jgi:hypothetical protein
MEAIRTVVRDAVKQKDRSGLFNSLRSLIDFNETASLGEIALQSTGTPRKVTRKILDRKRNKIDWRTSAAEISGRRMMISEAVARRKEMGNT